MSAGVDPMIAPSGCARMVVIRDVASRDARDAVASVAAFAVRERHDRSAARLRPEDRCRCCACSGSDRVRAMPASDGRPSRSGHKPRAVVDELPSSRLRRVGDRLVGPERAQAPSKPGSVKPAVSMKLLRCGRCWPPDAAVMSVFGSGLP